MKKSRKKCWILQKSGLWTFIFTIRGFSTNWQILLLKRDFPSTYIFLGPKNCWRRSACNSKNDFLWRILDLENNFIYDLFSYYGFLLTYEKNNPSLIKKIFDNIKLFRKNLYSVVCASLCSTSEVMLRKVRLRAIHK